VSDSRPTAGIIMEPHLGGANPAVSSAKGEHVFNAVNRIMEEQLLSILNDCPAGDRKDEAQAAIQKWRTTAIAFAGARDDENFHVSNKGDPMNSARYSRMKSELEKAAQDLASGDSSLQTRGYTIFNRRLNDLTAIDVNATALEKGGSVHAIDFVAAETRRDKLQTRQKPQFDAWLETTSGLMYATIVNLRDAAKAVGLAHGR
jgi:hypothetical protein